jgi:hypothetical protein
MWEMFRGGAGIKQLIWPLMFGGLGLLSLLFGLLPVPNSLRGLIAAIAGLAPLVVGATVGGLSLGGGGGGAGGGLGMFGEGWKAYVGLAGMVLAPTGLLLRSAYRGAALGRILSLVGCGAIVALFLIPVGGSLPLIMLIKSIGAGGGFLMLVARVIFPLVLFAAAALGLIMSWMPSGTSGGTGLFAWIIILWTTSFALFALIASIVGGAPIGELFKQPIIFYMLLDTLAFSALSAYGLATIFGKSLEA